MFLTALISFNQNRFENDKYERQNDNSVADKIRKHQNKSQNARKMPKNDEILDTAENNDFVMLDAFEKIEQIEVENFDVTAKDDEITPTLMQKSESRCLAGSEYEHLHPRMIYEILNHIKFEGKIDSAEIMEILAKFSDLNTPENI